MLSSLSKCFRLLCVAFSAREEKKAEPKANPLGASVPPKRAMINSCAATEYGCPPYWKLTTGFKNRRNIAAFSQSRSSVAGP